MPLILILLVWKINLNSSVFVLFFSIWNILGTYLLTYNSKNLIIKCYIFHIVIFTIFKKSGKFFESKLFTHSRKNYQKSFKTSFWGNILHMKIFVSKKLSENCKVWKDWLVDSILFVYIHLFYWDEVDLLKQKKKERKKMKNESECNYAMTHSVYILKRKAF